MTMQWLGLSLAAVAFLGLHACGLQFFDRWDGAPVLVQHFPQPADVVWERLTRELDHLDLLVSEIRARERLIQFGWVTAPGDGRLYVRCVGSDPVGSASLRARLVVRPEGSGSVLVISSEARSTVNDSCRSTGRFEDWMLDTFAPAIAQAGRPPAPDSTSE